MKKLIALIGAVFMAAVTHASSTNSITFNFDLGATNWAAIPFAVYDVQTKDWGYGGALMYKVHDNFWAGYRMQNISGRQLTAAVQGQLQIAVKVGPVTVVPLFETSLGLGKDNLWGGAGPGGIVHLYSLNSKKFTLDFAVAGVYEHYIEGSKNGDEVLGGLVLNLKF